MKTIAKYLTVISLLLATAPVYGCFHFGPGPLADAEDEDFHFGPGPLAEDDDEDAFHFGPGPDRKPNESKSTKHKINLI